MIAFFDACHINMWEVVENDNYIPTNKEGVEIPRSLWKEEQKTMYLLNSKARNFLMCINGIRVRDFKISMLVDKYELFKMEDNKTINPTFGRFQMIINNLISLDKT
ncbi:hypothetical protein CR513_29776, partial [Mucuna pruriens]